VDAADVDDELLVDEYERVVVAGELERLVAAVLEQGGIGVFLEERVQRVPGERRS